MQVRGPNWQGPANYGTASNPALILTPKRNDAKPTTPRHVTPPAFIQDDTRAAGKRLVDQQWRDAVRLGLLADIPDSINATAPGGG